MAKITSKISKQYIINLPLTPASFTTKKPEIISENAAILEISCGGGMGGSHWKEYVIDFDFNDLNRDGLIQVTLFTGETKFINTRNIVTAKPRAIIRASVKHSNTNFKDNYWEMYFTIHKSDIKSVKLNESYFSYSDKSPNVECLEPFNTVSGVV